MFTGIVEELGKVQQIKKSNESSKIVIECRTILEDIKLGDSIAVNGVCLTVTAFNSSTFEADISPETYKVTTLSQINIGDFVNLERAMKADGRFGGHIVSGHIDNTAKFTSIEKKDNFYEMYFELSNEILKYTIQKGSITINGISLTIADVKNNNIKLAIIPHTYENTNLKYIKKGDFVNIEVDMIAKYIENFVSASDNKSKISLEFLQEHGF